VWIGGALALFVPIVIFDKSYVPAHSRALLAGAIAWLIGTLVTTFRFATFKCPRCGKTFSRPTSLVSVSDYCVNCGLPLGARSASEVSPKFRGQ